ncbi:hypothetical protein D7Z54_18905 [Salibacterium salarium]|uniref:L-lysine N6-monooxygenase MbtG n=1 Tax=Salibacterium salarium TaxID=284579 RepID=A0A3R9RBU4_9BACI|nr:SidA/IucD/PvdA family monooxygenase [Salibacterium salarium]RSL31866.1 hypothetical protein D7Z54_18905 [Salibacterium salarium]
MSQQYEEKDVVGVGLGPSNLALAVALFENQDTYTHNDFLFLEKSQKVSWHPGMILENKKTLILNVPVSVLRGAGSFFCRVLYETSSYRRAFFWTERTQRN